MRTHTVNWKDATSLEQLGARWAERGLEPSISTDAPCEPGDVIVVKGQPFRLIVVRSVGDKEKRERERLMNFVSDMPYRYIVRTD